MLSIITGGLSDMVAPVHVWMVLVTTEHVARVITILRVFFKKKIQ